MVRNSCNWAQREKKIVRGGKNEDGTTGSSGGSSSVSEQWANMNQN